MARMILLGVGTAVPDAHRGYTHMVFDGPGGPLLIDAGGEVYQRLLRAGIDPRTLQGIILTHSHADHINGLAGLLFSLSLAGRRDPLPIYGLEPTLTRVQHILNAFELDEHCSPVSWRVLRGDDHISLAKAWVLKTACNAHTRPCLALRFQDPTGSHAITYSGDTAPCQAVIDLARQTTLLIHEATVGKPSEGHTTPGQAGQVAVQAGAGRLVLVHFSPVLAMPEAEALEAVRAAGFGGPAEVGSEYQVLELQPPER